MSEIAERSLQRLWDALSVTAIERRRTGYGARERELIRNSGLLAAPIPLAYGGLGLEWPQICALVGHIAGADGALAQIFGVHYLQIATLSLYGNATQHEHIFGRTLFDRGFWGEAYDPVHAEVNALPYADDFILQGRKSFCRPRGSDYLLVSAQLPEGEGHICAAVAALQRGVSIEDDGVLFEEVRVAREAVLPNVNEKTKRLRGEFAQQLSLALSEGVVQARARHARRHVREYGFLPEIAFYS